MSTRRTFLKYALFGGAAAATEGLPAAIRRAYAIAPEPGTTYLNAEHVVILMQENRSFDHMFGTLAGVRGFNDRRAIRQKNGSSVFVQSGESGETYAPWRLNIHDTKVTWMGSIPHSRDSQVDAWNGGHHDRWIDVKRPHKKEYRQYPLTMGYYTREDLPFYYALADAFTVCDQNYCGVMSSTTPNRLVFWTGTVRDQQNTASNVYMRNPEILEGGMTWTTFPERLEKVGVSWKFYQNELSQTGGMSPAERSWLSNFGCNVLECFDSFNVSSNLGFGEWIEERIRECSEHINRLENLEMLVSGERSEQLVEAKALMEVLKKRQKSAKGFEKLTPEERALFTKAFVINSGDPDYRSLEELAFVDDPDAKGMKAPKGDVLYQFRKDVRTGQLPAVSWMAAPEHFSDHPTSAWYGAWYVSEVMNILTENPEVWKKTIFILTYDENDGYFDHGCSYAAPDPQRPETGRSSASIGADGLEYTTAEDEVRRGVPERLARSGPIGLGFRVPMVVASPWSRGGLVNSQLFDHSSTLRFLEHFVEKKFGTPVRETNISPWRRAICGDLTSCFHPHDEVAPSLNYLDRNTHLKAIEDARNRPMPGGFRSLSADEIAALKDQPDLLRQTVRQESGTRPACALPYELYCDGGINVEHGQVSLTLGAGQSVHGERAAGAPFNVYDYRNGGRDMQAGTYAVAAGDRMDVTLPAADGLYDVAVHAPNGFYRAYRGHADRVALRSACHYEVGGKGKAPGIVLSLTNAGKTPLTVQYRIGEAGPLRTVVLKARGHQEIRLDLSASHQWYDVTLTSPEDPDFRHVLGGRMETGKITLTDPAMAG
ncbi:phospholipase [Gluconobacter oxydans]|uniref:phospholipase C n=2 Tax=Gluconobacter oxydans TaxID=442 RepID=A0AB34XJZ2_GLUOY|nr:phospholipase C, phosphocholine-specific [Gluconobacter oxydans]AHK72164.1 Non-hemolytic phospholipase C [Gluconobacter oxydans DSM 3504]KXV09976.1 phospholipase [Gluconobacter oxydans]